MTVALFLRTVHRGDYGRADFGEFTKCLAYQLNSKFVLRQWYASLMAALVEKAAYLGHRLVDTATFADKGCGRLVIVAADGQPRFSCGFERSQFMNQGVWCIAVAVESRPSLNPEMLIACSVIACSERSYFRARKVTAAPLASCWSSVLTSG